MITKIKFLTMMVLVIESMCNWGYVLGSFKSSRNFDYSLANSDEQLDSFEKSNAQQVKFSEKTVDSMGAETVGIVIDPTSKLVIGLLQNTLDDSSYEHLSDSDLNYVRYQPHRPIRGNKRTNSRNTKVTNTDEDSDLLNEIDNDLKKEPRESIADYDSDANLRVVNDRTFVKRSNEPRKITSGSNSPNELKRSEKSMEDDLMARIIEIKKEVKREIANERAKRSNSNFIRRKRRLVNRGKNIQYLGIGPDPNMDPTGIQRVAKVRTKREKLSNEREYHTLNQQQPYNNLNVEYDEQVDGQQLTDHEQQNSDHLQNANYDYLYDSNYIDRKRSVDDNEYDAVYYDYAYEPMLSRRKRGLSSDSKKLTKLSQARKLSPNEKNVENSVNGKVVESDLLSSFPHSYNENHASFKRD